MAGETKQAKDSKIRQLRDENGSLKARIEELLIATAPGNLATLEDSSKLKADIAVLNDSVKAKDTEIAQLQDSLTKSDAAFLTVKAELADAISYEHEKAIVVDFLDKLTPEGKTALSERLGLATVEDSAELGDKRKLSLTSKEISEWATNLKEHDEPGLEWTEGVNSFFKFIVKNWDFPGNRADAKAILQAQGVKMKDSTQDGAEAARDAHNVEAEGSTPSPATKPEGTAPVADVESPGEKWWREFQEGLSK